MDRSRDGPSHSSDEPAGPFCKVLHAFHADRHATDEDAAHIEWLIGGEELRSGREIGHPADEARFPGGRVKNHHVAVPYAPRSAMTKF